MEYLDKVKDESLIEFLNANGLFVLDDINECRNNNGAENIYLRCASSNEIADKTFKEIKAHIFSKFPLLFSGNDYSNDRMHLFSLDDFFIQRIIV